METMTASAATSPHANVDPETDDTPSIPFEDLKAKGAPWCRDHLRRLVKRGKFPAPTYVSDRKALWTPRQIREFIAKRKAGGAA